MKFLKNFKYKLHKDNNQESKIVFDLPSIELLEQSNIFKIMSNKAIVTDFASYLGVLSSNNFDREGMPTGNYLLKNHSADYRYIAPDGRIEYSTNECILDDFKLGIRPVIHFKGIPSENIFNGIIPLSNNIKVGFYGEYPNELSNINNLNENLYFSDKYYEVVKGMKKYIIHEYCNKEVNEDTILDIPFYKYVRCIFGEDIKYFNVEPVKWFIDEYNHFAISEKILVPIVGIYSYDYMDELKRRYNYHIRDYFYDSTLVYTKEILRRDLNPSTPKVLSKTK